MGVDQVWHVVNQQVWESQGMRIRHVYTRQGEWKWCVFLKVDDYTEGRLLVECNSFELAKAWADKLNEPARPNWSTSA